MKDHWNVLIIFVVSEKACENFPIGSNVNLCPVVVAILDFRSEQKNRNLVKWLPMQDIVLTQYHIGKYREKKILKTTELNEPILCMNDH
jgi:hypothetical protein